MKTHFPRFVVLALLFLVVGIPFHALALEEEPATEILPELVTEEVVVPQPDPIPDVTTEVSYQERLEDMQVLLMYLCGMAIFWTFVGCGKLLYRFFNMFF